VLDHLGEDESVVFGHARPAFGMLGVIEVQLDVLLTGTGGEGVVGETECRHPDPEAAAKKFCVERRSDVDEARLRDAIDQPGHGLDELVEPNAVKAR
jgi:hypothetical protein